MSLEREIRKIMAKAVMENFVKNNPDCEICGDGSPCTCGESQEVNEMNPAKHVQKNDKTGMFCVYNNDGEKVKEFKDKADAVKYATDNHDKLMEKLDADDTPQVQKIVKKLKGASKAHANQAKSLEKELSDDIRDLPKDKQRALQHADKTAKPKSKVSLAPTPGIKIEDLMKKKIDKKTKALGYNPNADLPRLSKANEETNLDEAFEEFFAEGMKVFSVSTPNQGGNVHAKNEKEAIAKARAKGMKGKLTIRDKGPVREDIEEGYEGEVKKVLDKKGIDAYFKNGKLMVSKRDKAMVMKILKGQDLDMPTIQVEEIQMEKNRFGLSVSLVDAVADVLAGKRPVEEKKKMKKDDDEDDKKAPVTDKDDDGDGMDPVGKEDGDIDNDGDKDSSDKFLAKKRKAIGKAMSKDGGGKEPVDTKPKMDEKLTPQQKNVRDRLRGVDRSQAKSRGDDNVKPSTAPKDSRSIEYGNQRKNKLAPSAHAPDKVQQKYDDGGKGHDSERGRKKSDPRGQHQNPQFKDKLAKVRDKKDTDGPKGKLPEDMSDGQMKRREEIVKELKKKSADFESRYGDKADAVMYATATKMAMKGK